MLPTGGITVIGRRLLIRPTAMLACKQRDRARDADQTLPAARPLHSPAPRTAEGGAMEPPTTDQEAIGHNESPVPPQGIESGAGGSRLGRPGQPAGTSAASK